MSPLPSAVWRREPAQIAALDHVVAGCQDAREPAPFRRVLPVDGAQRFDILVEKDAGNDAMGGTRFHAIPGAQHQRQHDGAGTQSTLCARQRPRAPSFHPSLQSRGIPMAPPEMLVERKEDTRSRRFIAVWKPELVIAFLICGDGVQAISRQFAEDGQRSRIRQRRSREAVRGSSDNQRGREALRPPHRMRRHGRYRGVGWETPTPSGARVG